MEAKKISFGFSKITKKPNLFINKKTDKDENKLELIKCLEGQEIKLVEEKKKEEALVIPMKENKTTAGALASLMKRRAVLLGEDDEPAGLTKAPNLVDAGSNGNDGLPEDLEKRAARELMSELSANGNEAAGDHNLVLPVVKPEDLLLDGAKESTLDDYDSIPIEKFGMAMLRGMGFVEPPPKKLSSIAEDGPMVRPKGMGLGADKVLRKQPLLVQPEKYEVLEIKRNAFVRILGGKQKDLYGQIEGFDDHSGRIIVKMAIGGCVEVFNEFMCQPVSKGEYEQYAKCINTAKYQEYKNMENEHGQIIIKKEDDKCAVRPAKNESSKTFAHAKQYIKEEKYKREFDRKEDTCRGNVKEDYSRHVNRERQNRSEKNASNRYQDHDEHDKSKSKRYHGSTHLDDTLKYRHKSNDYDDDTKAQSSSRYSQNRVPDVEFNNSSVSSDSDSAYECRSKKKSSKSKSKRKSKCNRRENSSSDEEKQHNRSHNKKTKKSKKERYRSRSRERK